MTAVCSGCGNPQAYLGEQRTQCPNSACEYYDASYEALLKRLEESEDDIGWINLKNREIRGAETDQEPDR